MEMCLNDDTFSALYNAKKTLPDAGPISFLPVYAVKKGRDKEFIILCYNSHTHINFLVKVIFHRIITTGPCTYIKKFYLLQRTDAWAEHVLTEENLQLNVPEFECVEIYYDKKVEKGEIIDSVSPHKESFDELQKFVNQENISDFIEKLSKFSSHTYRRGSFNVFKKRFKKFPGYRCSWENIAAKSARK